MATKKAKARIERIELMTAGSHSWSMSNEQELPTFNFGWAGERIDDLPEAVRPKEMRAS